MAATPKMSFVESVTTVVKEKYLCFDGRARRSEYWWYALAYAGVNAVLNIIPMGKVSIILSALVGLGLLLPSLGVCVRRLHDIGKSGWYLLVSLIPVVGVFIVIYWMAKDGDPAANEYGASPKYVEE